MESPLRMDIAVSPTRSYPIEVYCCESPECTCREVQVTCSRNGRALSEREYQRLFVDDEVASFPLDMDTGEIKWEAVENAKTALEAFPWFAQLVAHIKGEHLEEMAKTACLSQGHPVDYTVDTFNLGTLGEGYHFCSNEVFDLWRDDIYAIDGCLYDAYEDYCVDPDCDCGEVKVIFGPNSSDMLDDAWVGHVQIDKSGTLTLEEEDGPLELLERLWSAYVNRFPDYSKRHAFFYPKMKELGRALRSYRNKQQWDRLGPNELCLCGSGKKYKKCCFLKRFGPRT